MRALGAIAATAVLLAAGGCGGGGGKATTGAAGATGTTTGPDRSTAPPSGQRPLEESKRPADPAAVRVIRGWTDAQRASDVDRATSYFAVPAIVENGTAPVELRSRGAIREFNAGLPCGAVLLRTSAATMRLFTVATFRLVDRPGQHCDGTGAQARTAFGIEKGRIHAWVRLPDRPQGRTPQPPTTTGPSI
jgi:hypothetical protein